MLVNFTVPPSVALAIKHSLKVLANVNAMMANIHLINTAMARPSDSLTSLGTLPATLLPEDFSLPVIPPLKGPETDPANWTDEDLGKKPRRIGFNREDEESEKE